MLKKNQLALILLTLVLMLTVYFITKPFDKDKDENGNNDDLEETGRLVELLERRQAIREERSLAVLALDAIIADSSKTIDEKAAALEEKRYLNSISEKELMLEFEVMAMGYRDVLVHATSTGIEVLVVAPEHSAEKANEIIIKTMLKFNEEFENVTVQFKTAQQVMGEVS